MLVFIDESGDPGFKPGASPYLVIGAVTFAEREQAEKAGTAIKAFTQAVKLPEMKFSATTNHIKNTFFEMVSEYRFAVSVTVCNKALLEDRQLKKNAVRFYEHNLHSLIGSIAADNMGLFIHIDGAVNAAMRKVMTSQMRGVAPLGTIKKVRLIDSRDDSLIQLADMVTGCIARPLSKPNQKSWRKCIEGKIREEIILP